ncbi:autoinducer binding domain-containing protein [Bradyrhizobium sp. Ai1a-2]|uniref:autoinducer binding domain-containing protein n=1 Tax=Bradyrhizobium sp. Ai1a-2 TaxID=196490 RepID=UPI00040FF7C4|nr:autoinducer binding domain-containing protein [Bradyrhizobium sp. Ai1a-2]
MKWADQLFEEFVDAILTARDDHEFERTASRAAHGLGFRWFAYLRVGDGRPSLISSYPKSWTSRYLRLNYHGLDPVIQRARVERGIFSWGTQGSALRPNKEQRRFFEEATTFGIKSGITVPIRSGFGQMAAFTLATDDPIMKPDRVLARAGDIVQLIGIYFQAHLSERIVASPVAVENACALSQRERQCLAWAARGKTLAEAAVLIGITSRTVAFHLENARRKLGAVTIAHAVAQAVRRGLLP